MKLPILKAEYSTAATITSVVAGILCLAWLYFRLPGFEYSTAGFLLFLTLMLFLFSSEASRPTNQFIALVFVVGTGIILIAARFDLIMNGISYGPSLMPVNDQLGVLSGLLWLIPLLTSLRLSEKLSDNVYLRSLFGALFVLAPTLFMLMSSDSQMLIFWDDYSVSAKAIIIWFVGAFFFHFAANQMEVQKSNPIAAKLYFVYLGFFVAAEVLKLMFFQIGCITR